MKWQMDVPIFSLPVVEAARELAQVSENLQVSKKPSEVGDAEKMGNDWNGTRKNLALFRNRTEVEGRVMFGGF